ncbi:hypothetical protein ACP4OV_002221 [Aristida adscensionis]
MAPPLVPVPDKVPGYDIPAGVTGGKLNLYLKEAYDSIGGVVNATVDRKATRDVNDKASFGQQTQVCYANLGCEAMDAFNVLLLARKE